MERRARRARRARREGLITAQIVLAAVLLGALLSTTVTPERVKVVLIASRSC